MTATFKPVLYPEHLLNKQIFQCTTTAQFASVLGNICQIGKEFILSRFPPGSIKDVHLDTSHLSRAYYKVGTKIKKEKPYMVIRPKFDAGANSLFGDSLPEWIEAATWLYQDPRGYTPILEDKDHGFSIYNIPDRIKLTLSFEIYCDTQMEEWNFAMYLRNSFKHRRPFYLYNQELEAIVPKKYIEVLANIFHYDLTKVEDREIFHNYLDAHAIRTITEKISTSSGRPNYYYPHHCNLLCNFEDYPDIDEGDDKGQVKTNFKITDNMTVETWMPMNYIFIGESVLWDDVNRVMAKYGKGIDDDLSSVYFSKAFPYDITPDKLADGKTKITKLTYLIDDPKAFNSNYDTVDFSNVIPFKYREMIHYIKAFHLDIKRYFEIRIYGNSERERLDLIQCKIDWDNFKIINKYPKLGGKYTVAIYANFDACNKLYRRLHNDLRETSPYQDIPVDIRRSEGRYQVKDLNTVKVARPEVRHEDEFIEGNLDLENLTQEDRKKYIDEHLKHPTDK